MTRQEEIRKGIAMGMAHCDAAEWAELSDGVKRFHLSEADRIRNYLHSKDVVIEPSDISLISSAIRGIKEKRREGKYAEADKIREEWAKRGVKFNYRRDGKIEWEADVIIQRQIIEFRFGCE